MPDSENGSDNSKEARPPSKSPFVNGFGSGKDRASDAEKSTEALRGCTPGAGSGDWDEDEESVSGDVSAFVHGLEAGRDPWHPRQTAHGALHVMSHFLGPHFSSFQTVADDQRQVSEDPGSASGVAASAVASSAAQKTFRQAAKIRDEDRPSVSEEARRTLARISYQTEGAVLVADGMTHILGVAVDPSLGKAYTVTETGKLYSVDLTTNTKHRIITSGDSSSSLGLPSGLALDDHGGAYITDNSGASGRLLRVNLTNGRIEAIAAIPSACGVALDHTANKAYVTSFNGKLCEVDLHTKTQRTIISEGLGSSTSAVALDGRGKAYTGNRDAAGSMRQIDLRADTPAPQTMPVISQWCSGGIALDMTGRGRAYVTDHVNDVLYTVDLATGKERESVKATGAFSPLGIALDDLHGLVYAGTWEGQLWRFPLRVLQSPELIEITTRV
ncbi:hypothetical protein ACIGAN_26400 [Streptomyces sp. NPDC085931]|uniref:hypothetical protein n=1 Tax=Streptomyces sp. NPDC085931 TaxID=3365740 RepID=UPI0037CCF278